MGSVRLAIAGAIFCAICACPALGQDPRGLPPPAYSTVDSNGVDIGSGRLVARYDGPVIAGSSDLRLDYDMRYLLELRADNRRAYVEQDASSPIPQAIGYTVVTPTNQAQFQRLANGNSIIPWHVRGGETLSFGYPGVVFTEHDGTVYYFGDHGYSQGNLRRWYVSQIVKPNGEIQSYSYIPNTPYEPQLSAISSTSGYMIKQQPDYSRITVLNRAIDYCDPGVVACTYSRNWPSVARDGGDYVDNLGRRTQTSTSGTAGSLTTPEGAISGGRTTSVSFGSGATVSGQWYFLRTGRVVSLTNGEGTWTYVYKAPVYFPPLAQVGYPDLKRIYTTRTDPQQHTVDYVTYFGSLASLKDELGRETKMTVVIREGSASDPYEGRTLAVVQPEGDRTDYQYDDRGNITEIKTTPKPGSNLAVRRRIASFPASCTNPKTCNQPNYVVDENGNRTDYTYAAWGGIASELSPAAGGVRALKLWRYVQAYAYVKDASGSLVPAEAPIWRLSEMVVCRTGANASNDGCATPADEIVTRYEYGAAGTANALLPRARIDDATGTPRRTCLAYSDLGQMTAETSPRGGLATCQ